MITNMTNIDKQIAVTSHKLYKKNRTIHQKLGAKIKCSYFCTTCSAEQFETKQNKVKVSCAVKQTSSWPQLTSDLKHCLFLSSVKHGPVLIQSKMLNNFASITLSPKMNHLKEETVTHQESVSVVRNCAAEMFVKMSLDAGTNTLTLTNRRIRSVCWCCLVNNCLSLQQSEQHRHKHAGVLF